MTGHRVKVTPPFPGENYTMQGVATLDEKKKQARLLFGGSTGKGHITFDNVPEEIFGDRVHAWVREIEWSGQLGDSPGPQLLAERDVRVGDDVTVVVGFGDGGLPKLKESSAYEIILSPAGKAVGTQSPSTRWKSSYEAEDAAHTGSGYSKNGPEGSPLKPASPSKAADPNMAPPSNIARPKPARPWNVAESKSALPWKVDSNPAASWKTTFPNLATL